MNCDDTAFARHARERDRAVTNVSPVCSSTVCKLLGQEEIKPHKVRYYLNAATPSSSPRCGSSVCLPRVQS